MPSPERGRWRVATVCGATANEDPAQDVRFAALHIPEIGMTMPTKPMKPRSVSRVAEHRLGVISDTHGLLRPMALEALAGVELIIHAGDIGNREVLQALQTIAPVIAVRGNNDKGAWADSLQDTAVVEVDKVILYVLHDVKKLDLDPAAAGFHVVISGHSHRPSILKRQGVLFVNPGSAGPRRFSLPISLACLFIRGDNVVARLIELAG